MRFRKERSSTANCGAALKCALILYYAPALKLSPLIYMIFGGRGGRLHRSPAEVLKESAAGRVPC